MWFFPGALEAISEVTFGHDDKGNWDGTWITTEDKLAQDILNEDLGIDLEFENLPDIETQWYSSQQTRSQLKPLVQPW